MKVKNQRALTSCHSISSRT
ncbi:hypothetical protein CFC21_012340, partial [Triticum aestivum]